MRKLTKNLSDRIWRLESYTNPLTLEVIAWNDNDNEELTDFIARKRNASGFKGEYIVIVGISGRWIEKAGRSEWERPSIAEARYAKWGRFAPD